MDWVGLAFTAKGIQINSPKVKLMSMLCKQLFVVAFLIPRRWALWATNVQQSAHPKAEAMIPVNGNMRLSYHLVHHRRGAERTVGYGLL